MLALPIEIVAMSAETASGEIERVNRHFTNPIPIGHSRLALESMGISWPFDRNRTQEFLASTKNWYEEPDGPLIQPIGWQVDPRIRIISNACVSGAQAVIEASDSLLDNECEFAVISAGDEAAAFVTAGFESLHALASKTAKPFDRSRDGLMLGTADASVYLRCVESSSYHPRIISYGCSNDANHISGPSQDGSGLALAIERALGGIDKSEIRAICAHGTATVYNDAMEARAFHTVFNGNPPPVFGIKGAIGHTLGAAGLIEVIVSAKVATEGLIPPTVGFEQGEDEYPLDIVHGEPRRIEPGYVLTTNSGFGGMNTAIVVGPGAA